MTNTIKKLTFEPCPLYSDSYHVFANGNRIGMVIQRGKDKWEAIHFGRVLGESETRQHAAIKLLEVLPK